MGCIIIALPKIEDTRKIRGTLMRYGFEVSAICTSGAAALQEASAAGDAGILITSCRLSDMHYTDLKEYLPPFFELLLLGSAHTLSANGVSGVIAVETPIRIHDLVNTVRMMLAQQEKQKKQKRKFREEREENYIRNAKYLLMERNHMDEAEAYRYIQKSSMDTGTNMAETAQMILMLMYDEV